MQSFNEFHSTLFNWWRLHGRVLPWREKMVVGGKLYVVSDKQEYKEANSVREKIFDSYFSADSFRDPYRVVVAEVMLQQTQVDRVKEKYVAWMKKWPTINDLANASLGDVIIEWKGLGYNRRARFLWLLAKEITQRRNHEEVDIQSGWPVSEKELLKLPGIGEYTARAVMSFAQGQQVGVVDTNIKRIFSRVFNLEEQLFKFADELIPQGLADPWNQLLMDFGAMICTAKKPKCEICPAAHQCDANLQAIKEGYKNYSGKLSNTEVQTLRKKKTHKSKDIKDGKKIPFEQTDRYLRGRIIDVLRDQSIEQDKLIQFIHSKYPQFESQRILTNIQQLLNEQMIQKNESSYVLG